jgi:hypothetical protein
MSRSRTFRALTELIVLGVVVSACARLGQAPRVELSSGESVSVCTGQTRALTTKATGRDLRFAWNLEGSGTLDHSGEEWGNFDSSRYTAPDLVGTDTVTVTVKDAFGQTAKDQVLITVDCTPTPPPPQPPIITDPRAGDPVDMNIPVRGATPRGTPPPGTNLYVLVKPLGLDYWLQPTPQVNPTGWRGEAGVGQEGDGGKHFFICSILTAQDLQKGWHAAEPPPGEAHCIDVIRKTPTPSP